MFDLYFVVFSAGILYNKSGSDIGFERMRSVKKHTAAISAALFSLFIFSGCTTPPESEAVQANGMYFDTVVQIQAWGTPEETVEHCMALCEYYEGLFSATIDTSEISEINQAGGQPVEVSDETAELIRKGIEYGELSRGRFDITIDSASRLWDFKDNEDKTLPDPDALKEAVRHIDYRCVRVDGNTVTLSDPQARIDLGGIAKGYIADRLKDYLESEGTEHALINLGGNMLAVGNRYDGTDFRIGIQEPFAKTGVPIAAVSISDRSVVTSGDYERYFEKDGVIYHHILDPDTGYPVQNDLDQVTVISDESVDGDALSTTCYALGLDEGMELIRSLDDVEAVFVTKDGEIHRSSNAVQLENAG